MRKIQLSYRVDQAKVQIAINKNTRTVKSLLNQSKLVGKSYTAKIERDKKAQRPTTIGKYKIR